MGQYMIQESLPVVEGGWLEMVQWCSNMFTINMFLTYYSQWQGHPVIRNISTIPHLPSRSILAERAHTASPQSASLVCPPLLLSVPSLLLPLSVSPLLRPFHPQLPLPLHAFFSLFWCYELNCVPPPTNSYIAVLTVSALECDLI